MTGHPARHAVDLDAIRAHHHTAKETRTPVAVWTAVTDIPVLLAETGRLRTLLALTRAQHADLLAAARATIAAARDGEPDPLYYIHDELNARGQLPPRHLHAAELLALAAAIHEDTRW